jgi:hypothetical protein
MAAAVLLLAGMGAKADDRDSDNRDTRPLFHNNEVSLDLFGTYLNPEQRLNKLFDTNIRHGTWGGGVGLNYFPICFLGLGADTSFQDGARKFCDHVGGNLILRLPIEPAHLAPYIFGGGGRRFDPVDAWFFDAGVGLDVRFTRHVGIFGDARYIWHESNAQFGARFDQALFRTGLKIAF